jgi:glycine/D-amino acid oxidase-like deaminating enzyme
MTGSHPAADVAIVGCGIIGLAAAERLTADGKSVVMIDQVGLAGGATGASGGLVRAVDLADQESRAADSLARYLRQGWQGRWPAVREHGSLTLARDSGLEQVAMAVDAASAAGHRVRVLSAAETRMRFPALRMPAEFIGVYEPRAGWLPARQVAAAMHRDAQAQGGGLRLLPARATGVLTSGSRVSGVQTTLGPVPAHAVLLAAGAGSEQLAGTAGVALPMCTRSISYCLFRPVVPAMSAGLPTVVDTVTGSWLRRWDSTGTVLAGVPSSRTRVPQAVLHRVPVAEQRRVRDVVRHRWPPIARFRVVGGVTAYDAMNIGGAGSVTAWPRPAGLITATGWNGGGFKLAPSVGREIADLVREVLA